MGMQVTYEEEQSQAPNNSGTVLSALVAIALPAFAYYLLYFSRLAEKARYGFDESLISLNLSEVPSFLVPAIWFVVAVVVFFIWSHPFSKAVGKLPSTLKWGTFIVVLGLGLYLDQMALVPFSWLALQVASLFFEADPLSVLHFIAMLSTVCCSLILLFSIYISYISVQRVALCRTGRLLHRLVANLCFIAVQALLVSLALMCLLISLAALYFEFEGGVETWIWMLAAILLIAWAVGSICKEDVSSLIPYLNAVLHNSPMKVLLAVAACLVLTSQIMMFVGNNDFFAQMPERRVLYVESSDSPLGAPREIRETWCVLTTFDGDRAIVRRAEISPTNSPDGESRGLYTVESSGDYQVVSLKDGSYDFFSAKVNFTKE